MTFAGTDFQQAIATFNQLSTDDQLSVLGSLYSEVKKSLLNNAQTAHYSHDVNDLFEQVEDMRDDNQFDFLRDVLESKSDRGDRTTLDPHPSKAMMELLPGAAKPAIEKYRELDTNSRLMFWYKVADEIGDEITPAIAGYSSSDAALQLADALQKSELSQQVQFLGQVL